MSSLPPGWRTSLSQGAALSHSKMCSDVHIPRECMVSVAAVLLNTEFVFVRSRRPSAFTAFSERQFRKYFAEADRLKGNTSANLLILLRKGSTTWCTSWASQTAVHRHDSSWHTVT